MTAYTFLLKDGNLIDSKGVNSQDALSKTGKGWSDVEDFEFESLDKLGE